MRPGRARPGCIDLATKPYEAYASFNEAGARTPRMPGTPTKASSLMPRLQ